MWRSRNPCALLVGMYNDAAALENSVAVPQKNKNRLLYDPAVPLLGKYSIELKEGIRTEVHNSSIHNIQKVEITQVSMDG